MSRARVTLAALAVVAAAAPRASAGPLAQKELAAAQAHWRELDYDLVPAAAERALAAPDASPAEKIEALRLKGSALEVLNDHEGAERAFAEIFAINPTYELPDETSPRVEDVFQRARARWHVAQEERIATELGASLAALALDVKLPSRPRGGRPLLVTVDLADPDRIADAIVLAYRRAGAAHWSTLSASAEAGTRTLAIPGAFTASKEAYTLELFVGVRHRSGVTLRRQGEPDRPLALVVEAGQVPVETPLYQRWWVWVAAGVVIVGGIFLADQALDAGPQGVEIRF